MIKEIVTNINELRRPCDSIEMNENITEIIKDLKDTLASKKGFGLSAPQLGYNKKISYIKVPLSINQNKEIQYAEYILINAKIIEKKETIQIKNEECLSFPGIKINTSRYIFITAEYLNEKMELQTQMFQDLIGLVMQHEIDHTNGKLIFDRKHIDINHRKKHDRKKR